MQLCAWRDHLRHERFESCRCWGLVSVEIRKQLAGGGQVVPDWFHSYIKSRSVSANEVLVFHHVIAPPLIIHLLKPRQQINKSLDAGQQLHTRYCKTQQTALVWNTNISGYRHERTWHGVGPNEATTLFTINNRTQTWEICCWFAILCFCVLNDPCEQTMESKRVWSLMVNWTVSVVAIRLHQCTNNQSQANTKTKPLNQRRSVSRQPKVLVFLASFCAFSWQWLRFIESCW